MKLTKLLFPLITFIVIITSCGKDDLPTVDGGLTAKPSMLAQHKTDRDVSPSTPTGKLDEPVVSFTVDGSTVKVSWTAITNAVGYQVVIEQGDISIKEKEDPTFLTATFTEIPDGEYTVKVRALAAVGQGINSSHFSDKAKFTVTVPTGVTPGVTPGSTVTRLATPIVKFSQVLYNSGKGKTTVSWDPIPSASSYSVEVDGVLSSNNTSSLSLSQLSPGPHVVTVIAKAGDANHSDSYAGTNTINVNNPKPISTPVISGTVSYTSANAGKVSVTPLFIWPPNNKLTTVTFVGSGLSTGTGSISASHNRDANATDYVTSPLTQSNLAPGTYTVTAKAIAGGIDYDDNWVNSAVGSETFTVLPGSLKGKLFDEYGVYTRDYELTSSFNLPLQLMASRLGTDKTGRDYTFTITATNGGGTAVTGVSAVSNVPHDQR